MTYLEESECSKMIGFQNDWIPKWLDSKMIGFQNEWVPEWLNSKMFGIENVRWRRQWLQNDMKNDLKLMQNDLKWFKMMQNDQNDAKWYKMMKFLIICHFQCDC